MKRRDLMTYPLAAAVAVLPVPALAEAEDPILKHYDEWLSSRSEWLRLSYIPGNENWDRPESKAAEARESDSLEAMIATPPRTFAGIAALAHALWVHAGPSLLETSEDYPAEFAYIDNRIMLAIWQATSGRDGLPPREASV